MDTHDPAAPLPAFLRGVRALYGLPSLRDLSRAGGVSPAVLSRLERGIIRPSLDVLFRWAAGIQDGQPAPDLWTDAVYAAAATWEGEAQFLLIRYADPVHDPRICWHLSRRSQALCATFSAPRLGQDPETATGVTTTMATFESVGRARYPRFAAALQGKWGEEAGAAAWFSVWRRVDGAAYTAGIRYLLDEDVPPGSPDAPATLWAWLVQTVWAPHWSCGC